MAISLAFSVLFNKVLGVVDFAFAFTGVFLNIDELLPGNVSVFLFLKRKKKKLLSFPSTFKTLPTLLDSERISFSTDLRLLIFIFDV